MPRRNKDMVAGGKKRPGRDKLRQEYLEEINLQGFGTIQGDQDSAE